MLDAFNKNFKADLTFDKVTNPDKWLCWIAEEIPNVSPGISTYGNTLLLFQRAVEEKNLLETETRFLLRRQREVIDELVEEYCFSEGNLVEKRKMVKKINISKWYLEDWCEAIKKAGFGHLVEGSFGDSISVSVEAASSDNDESASSENYIDEYWDEDSLDE